MDTVSHTLSEASLASSNPDTSLGNVIISSFPSANMKLVGYTCSLCSLSCFSAVYSAQVEKKSKAINDNFGETSVITTSIVIVN